LARLCRELPPPPGALAARVDQIALAGVVLEPWEDIVDPGGGEVEAFIACARTVVVLVDRLAELI
jgi:hypothetical protein